MMTIAPPPAIVDELTSRWNELFLEDKIKIELIGRKRNWGRPKREETTLTTWTVPSLPARVTWRADCFCLATKLRLQDGGEQDLKQTYDIYATDKLDLLIWATT